MPRKKKLNLTDENSNTQTLFSAYTDAFTVKNVSLNIIRSLSKTIDFENKQEVLNLLPLIQKQMEIVNQTNEAMITIQEKLNELNESGTNE